MIRQCTDVDEIWACRLFVSEEISANRSNPTYVEDMLKLIKIIDFRHCRILQGSTINEVDRTSFSEASPPSRRSTHIPILTLDEILSRELAKSYFLDYLSSHNLHRYVLFYVISQEWKKLVSTDNVTRAEARDNAIVMYTEYLDPAKLNYLIIDTNLIELLRMKLYNNEHIPDPQWFDSISKFLYDKIENDDLFLNNFYQSNLYKKLLQELDYDYSDDEFETKSDFGGDICTHIVCDDEDLCTKEEDNDIENKTKTKLMKPLELKHERSRSDCTEIVRKIKEASSAKNRLSDSTDNFDTKSTNSLPTFQPRQKLFAHIIEVVIRNFDSKYAEYLIQVIICDDTDRKIWQIYHRYSNFYELKENIIKKFPGLTCLPFPSKKMFYNTKYSILRKRMRVLNQFLYELCIRSVNNDEIYSILCKFLQPDDDRWRIRGSTMSRTLNTIVNPFKTGFRTIRNMPDNFMSGLSVIFLGRSTAKESNNFIPVLNSSYYIPLDQKSSEYPALTSALKLLDEVFDLQSRSQWLRRGIINRLLGNQLKQFSVFYAL